jgi:hypothetical protein
VATVGFLAPASAPQRRRELCACILGRFPAVSKFECQKLGFLDLLWSSRGFGWLSGASLIIFVGSAPTGNVSERKKSTWKNMSILEVFSGQNLGRKMSGK